MRPSTHRTSCPDVSQHGLLVVVPANRFRIAISGKVPVIVAGMEPGKPYEPKLGQLYRYENLIQNPTTQVCTPTTSLPISLANMTTSSLFASVPNEPTSFWAGTSILVIGVLCIMSGASLLIWLWVTENRVSDDDLDDDDLDDDDLDDDDLDTTKVSQRNVS